MYCSHAGSLFSFIHRPRYENVSKNSPWYITGVKQLFNMKSSYRILQGQHTFIMWDAIYFYDAIAQLSYHSAFMSNTVSVKLLYIDMLLIFLYLLNNPPGLSIWCRTMPSTGTLNKAQFINQCWDKQIFFVVLFFFPAV